jgi:predicted CopG family antitoxin
MKNITHQFKTILNLTEDEKSRIFVSSVVVFPNLKEKLDDNICFDSMNYVNASIQWEKIPDVISIYFKQKKNREERIGSHASKDEINSVMDKIYHELVAAKEIESGAGNFNSIERNAKKHLLNYSSIFANLNRVFIEGPSSTGKSFFALQHILLKRSDPKFKIAYLCASKHYCENMKYSFHKTNNVDVADYKAADRDLKKQKYDLVIMDEFECCGPESLARINSIVSGGIKGGNVWILCDTEKKYFNVENFIRENGFDNYHIKLSVNFRNSIAVGDFINRIYERDIYADFMVEYYKNITLRSCTRDGFENSFSEVINLLTAEEKFRAQDIKILTPKNINDSMISALVSKKRWARELKDYSRDNYNVMSFSNLNDFMGLESKAVILVDIDDSINNLTEVLYAAASRVTQKFVILAAEKQYMAIKDII